MPKEIGIDNRDEPVRTFHEELFGRKQIENVRSSNRIESGIRKKYYKEKKNGAEIFIEGDSFVVASKFSSELDIANLQSLNLSKMPGIYVLFNAHVYYVGQSAKEIISRLIKHQKTEGKKKVLEEGRVVFFGRTDSKLGKDQLDYLEKELIERFRLSNRSTLNENSGNTSHISEDHKIIADYLLAMFHSTASVSIANPYVEDSVYRLNRIGGILTDRIESLPIDTDVFGIKIEVLERFLKQITKNLKPVYSDLILIEYVWPSSPGAATPPIEKPNNVNPFYLASRDGFWPFLEIEKVKDFEDSLLNKFMNRRNQNLITKETQN